MAAFDRPVVSFPGKERKAKHARGGHIFIHATAADTNGDIGMWDTFTAPGTGPTRHTHTRETEIFRVIAGTYRFWCGDEQFDAPPGTTVALPPGVPHHWRNISDEPGRMFAIVTPGGFEQFFVEIERTSATTFEQVLAIQEKLGLIESTPEEMAAAEARHAAAPR